MPLNDAEFVTPMGYERIEPEFALKPCPFCGGKASLLKGKTTNLLDTVIDYHIVMCDENKCRCGTSYEKNSDEAISSWNKRFKELTND